MHYAAYATQLAILFLALSPCSVFAQSAEPEKTLATSNEVKTAGTSLPAAKGKAMFKRESSLLGGLGSDAKIFIDGNQVCALGNGKECSIELDSGKHIVKIDAAYSTGEYSKTFDLKPGNTYTFSVSERTAGSLASFAGVLGMVADNKINQDEGGKDNGSFTAKVIEEK